MAPSRRPTFRATAVAALVVAGLGPAGQVQEMVAPVGFTVSGTEGTVHDVFNPPVVEECLGEDPGSGELAYFHGEPFLGATHVTVAAEEDSATTGCPGRTR